MFTRNFALLVLGLSIPSCAFATPITPGGTVAPSVLSTSGFTAVSPTLSGTVSPGTFTANYSTTVYADTNNIYCPGCYDFVYVLTNATPTDTGGPGIIERTTMSNFDGFLANVGWASSGTGSVDPVSVDRTSSGGVLGFNFDTNGITRGQSSSFLIIQTNTTAYTAGLFSIQDGSAGTGDAYQPLVASAPEPSSLLLLGTGLIAVGGMVRRRIAAL